MHFSLIVIVWDSRFNKNQNLIHKFSNTERTPLEVLNLLTQFNGETLFINADNIDRTFNNDEFTWDTNSFKLHGLSGEITNTTVRQVFAPLMLCSQNGFDVQAVPFTMREEPEELGEIMISDEDGNETISYINNYFDISSEQISSCLD